MKNKFKIPFINKKTFKRRAKQCKICEEKKYELLDTHRIKEGGKYENTNCVCLCVKCHRKVSSGLIKTLGWKNSTSGIVLHIITETGKEKFI